LASINIFQCMFRCSALLLWLRGLPIAIIVLRITNGNFHAATTCLSFAATIDEAYAVLASQDWNVVFDLFLVHFIVHII
jgi:tRNA(His) 5'-end guanylyltransferase